jgi:8-oxo-dGTP pyrophosphatase MutT (NUDIX family)
MAATIRLFPFHQLPPGFGRTLEPAPDPPATPRPAATLVLLRPGRGNIETLLLKRSRRVGFIPGAYVFPGGAVDRGDALPDLLPRLAGLAADGARARLGRQERESEGNDGATPPPVAFFVAALRETFEETGVLLGAPPAGCRTFPVGGNRQGGQVRARLLEGRCTFQQVLEELGVDLDAGTLQPIGRWVTPEPERRRYDTRFFAAEVPGACPVEPDRGEIEEALWLTPAEALDRNLAGRLPLVYPTLRTLEHLAAFREVRQALEHFKGRDFPRLLPRLVRRPTGIEIAVDEPAHEHPGSSRAHP